MAREREKPMSAWEQLAQEAAAEYEQVQKELKEIDILIRQSTSEVEKLAQRNAQLTNKVRQMEINLDTYPRQDIREMYSVAQEAQMRLFMMRGQVEQLQTRQHSLERYGQLLRRIIEAAKQGAPAAMGVRATLMQEGPSTIIAQVIEGQENERQRLARQMHDGPAQSLTNLILQAEICERLFDTDPAKARSELKALKNAVNATFQQVREFIFDLRPMMLDDLGLVSTLRRYVQEFGERSGLSVQLNILGKERRLASHTEVTIFRVIQGLMKNVQEHAHANNVQITVDFQGATIIGSVEDDGSGFNVNEALASAQQHRAIGLSAMKNQVEMLGGRLLIESDIGRGTRVTFKLPAEPSSTSGP